MELRILRYFLTVAREETTTRAADVLHITQPTLSRQLAQLEYELGVKLFEHRGRRIVLTADGLLLRRRAEEILELVDKTEQEMGQHEENLQGTIHIGHGEFSSMNVLADCIAEFSKAYPLVRISFFSGTADVVKERMDRGLIDISLLMEPISLDKYDYIRLNVIERESVFMCPDDPLAEKPVITPEDLAGKPLIISHRQENTLINWMGPYYQEDNVRYTLTLPTIGAVLVVKRQGYMIAVQDSIPFRDTSRLIAVPIAGGHEFHSVLAWKRGQPFSRAAEKFIEHAKCFLGIDQTTY